MTNCAKCGAELIGSRKFCAACGAPTDPSSLKRDVSISSGPASQPAPPTNAQINVPSTAYGPPIAQGTVNPFAATASPSSRNAVSAATGAPYGPPPGTPPATPSSNPPGGLGSTAAGPPGPLDATAPAPPVSPLAVSNALSQRGAFQQAAGDRIAPPPASSPTGPNAPPQARPGTGTSPPPPIAGAQPAKKPPGTQMMANPMSLPRPASGSSPPGSNAPAASSQAKPPPQRTQVMDAAAFARLNPNLGGAPSAVSPSGAVPSAQATPPHPSAPNQPVAQPMPPSVHQAPPATAQPYSHGHQSPQPPPGQWGGGWGTPANAAPPPGAHGGYGFGYAPGARVNVTWSNGQRYPATVSQVSGTQCLVVFPDGQQHWVEMQYLTPG